MTQIKTKIINICCISVQNPSPKFRMGRMIVRQNNLKPWQIKRIIKGDVSSQFYVTTNEQDVNHSHLSVGFYNPLEQILDDSSIQRQVRGRAEYLCE